MQSTSIIKISLMVAFFLEVTIFGHFVSSLACFKAGNIMNIAMTFSGTLFLSIAMIDIVPEAISNFDEYFSENATFSTSSSLHRNVYFPLTMIISMVTFMVIMFIDKILIGHSHDHQYELSFINQPKRQEKYQQSAEMSPRKNQEIEKPHEHQNKENGSSDSSQNETNWKPFVLQIGMSIHAFFECLAVGLQQSPISVLSLASAILVHKWAEGLTLGLMYRKQGYSQSTVNIMIAVQGFVNVLGLLTGSFLVNQGTFVNAFFMSISVGTFLYISLAEVLNEQVRHLTKGKIIAILCANIFIAFIVWFEKKQEQVSQTALL